MFVDNWQTFYIRSSFPFPLYIFLCSFSFFLHHLFIILFSKLSWDLLLSFSPFYFCIHLQSFLFIYFFLLLIIFSLPLNVLLLLSLLFLLTLLCSSFFPVWWLSFPNVWFSPIFSFLFHSIHQISLIYLFLPYSVLFY